MQTNDNEGMRIGSRPAIGASQYIIRDAASGQQILPLAIRTAEGATNTADALSKASGLILEVIEARPIYRTPPPLFTPSN